MKRIAIGVKTRIATAIELVSSLSRGPFWWLVPVFCFLVPVALVLIVLQAVPLVAPFVYLLF